MTAEKHERKYDLSKLHSKATALLLIAALLLTLTVGGTLSYIVTGSALSVNRFSPAFVALSVSDDGKVTNTGNVDAYIRAAVVVNWMDNSGNVCGIKPNCTLSVSDNWTVGNDGFYYYSDKVAPSASTLTAPAYITDHDVPPSSQYSLSIEIAAEALQADGETDGENIPAHQDAWSIASIVN